MKQKIFGIAILAIAGLSMTAMAQKPCKQTCTTPAQCADSTACPRAPRAMNPFEGLNLTQEQQTKLQDLRKDRADKRRQDKKDRKNKISDNRRDYLKDVKSILTPEQYVQFLENSYVNAAVKGKKVMRDGRRDFKKMDSRASKDFKKMKGDVKRDVKRDGAKIKKEADKI